MNPARISVPYWEWTRLAWGADGLPDLLLCWIIAAAACVLVGATAVLPTKTKRAAYLRQIAEAIPRTAVTPTFSLKVFFVRRHSRQENTPYSSHFYEGWCLEDLEPRENREQ